MICLKRKYKWYNVIWDSIVTEFDIYIYIYGQQYITIGHGIFKYKLLSRIQCIVFMFEIFFEHDILLTRIVWNYKILNELLNELWYKIIHELLNELQYSILYWCVIVEHWWRSIFFRGWGKCMIFFYFELKSNIYWLIISLCCYLNYMLILDYILTCLVCTITTTYIICRNITCLTC